MELHLTAAGTPAQIMATLTRDTTRERGSNPGHDAILVAVRDSIAKQIGAGETLEGDQSPKNYTVSAKIDISINEQASGEDAERARSALVGGQPFTPTTPLPGADANAGLPPVFATPIGSSPPVPGDPITRRRASDPNTAAGPASIIPPSTK